MGEREKAGGGVGEAKCGGELWARREGEPKATGLGAASLLACIGL